MKQLRWLLFAISFFTYCQVNAQARIGISIDSFPIALHDSMLVYTSVHVINYSGIQFNGSVSLAFTLNGVPASSDTSGAFIFFQPTTLNIAPYDSVPEPITINTYQNAFNTVGSSVVVIWPISPSALTYDSSSYTVQIVSPITSVVKTLSDENTEVFINQQQLFVQTSGPGTLRHLRMYDVQGQQLLNRDISTSGVLDLNGYSTGCYMVELTFIDNSRKVYKVVNTGLR